MERTEVLEKFDAKVAELAKVCEDNLKEYEELNKSIDQLFKELGELEA